MKKIFVTGHVGRDPETRYAPSGESFVTFSLAVNSGTKASPRTDWMEVSCNGKLAEVVQAYVQKGAKLLIEGSPSVNAYVNKEGKPVGTLRIAAGSIEFLSSKSDDEDSTSGTPNAKFNAPGVNLKPDDIPF